MDNVVKFIKYKEKNIFDRLTSKDDFTFYYIDNTKDFYLGSFYIGGNRLIPGSGNYSLESSQAKIEYFNPTENIITVDGITYTESTTPNMFLPGSSIFEFVVNEGKLNPKGVGAQGNNSIICGWSCTIYGDNCFTSGIRNESKGREIFISGAGNYVEGRTNISTATSVFGANNYLLNNLYTTVFGHGNKILESNSTFVSGMSIKVASTKASAILGGSNTLNGGTGSVIIGYRNKVDIATLLTNGTPAGDQPSVIIMGLRFNNVHGVQNDNKISQFVHSIGSNNQTTQVLKEGQTETEPVSLVNMFGSYLEAKNSRLTIIGSFNKDAEIWGQWSPTIILATGLNGANKHNALELTSDTALFKVNNFIISNKTGSKSAPILSLTSTGDLTIKGNLKFGSQSTSIKELPKILSTTEKANWLKWLNLNIETALDSIIKIQNSLIGGVE